MDQGGGGEEGIRVTATMEKEAVPTPFRVTCKEKECWRSDYPFTLRVGRMQQPRRQELAAAAASLDRGEV